METRWVWLRRTNAALRRLELFPFTLLYTVIHAAIRVVQLRQGRTVLRVGSVTGKPTTLPHTVMLWLDRVGAGLPDSQFDICLRLPREASDANLQEVFSVLLTSPRLRSVGLYWDSLSLANDLPLLQPGPDRNAPAGPETVYEELDVVSFQHLQEFFHADHVGIAPPIAATRDAQTLLKRHAGRAYAVCLNVPVEHRSSIAEVEAMRPDLRFFDLADARPTAKAANGQSLCGYGLTLHERLALVQVADAYVGSFDELGCAALVSERPTVLLGGGNGEHPDPISRDDGAVWFPGPVEPTTLAEAVLRLLSRHIGAADDRDRHG